MSAPSAAATCQATSSSSERSSVSGGRPAELPFGGRRVDRQVGGLGRRRPGRRAPTRRAPSHSLASSSTTHSTLLASSRRGPEVPGARRAGSLPQRLGQQQVAGEGAEHVLPGTHGGRVAHAQRRALLDRAHGVGQQPVLTPVAPSDHVAGAGARHPGRAGILEERAPVGGRDELGAGLRARVRVPAPERVGLDEGPTRGAPAPGASFS